MEDVEKAYVAGIVDGEGTVTLTKHHKNETPSPYVKVANNNLQLLKWLKLRIGGTIVSKKKRLSHHNDSYVWYVTQNRALCFLAEIKDYLIIKKPHAELLIKDYKRFTHRAGKYTPEMLARKNELVEMIRKFNRR